MLTTTIMACKCKKIVAPAMNTNMFENPIVQDNLKTLEHYDYEECSTGCQMAIESMQQIKDFTQDTTLFQLIEKYIDRHSRLGGNAKDHLIDSGNEVKTPGMMASAFSWFSTELKLNLNDDNSKIAKLLIDGCSMGIKTLGERANTLNRADRSADALARKIIKTEEEMIRELESFL